MPRSEEDNQQIRASRRSEILAAATRVFTEKGLSRAKVTDIAAAASLSNGLLYHYFTSKEAVFEAIVEEMIAQSDQLLAVPRERAVDRLVFAVIRKRNQLAEQTVDASRVVMQAVLHGEVMSEHLRALLADHLQRITRATAEMIAQAQADGDIDAKVPPDELMRVMIYLFRGMSITQPDFTVELPQVESLLAALRLTPSGMRRAAKFHPSRDQKAAV
ncbi:MAG TPA: helix-turn-helix domain-containing protein [Nannocystaceae bacterium]|nr:helix-turn-helix domain-containing protein [Nannocystaceae bacterium]